MVAQNLFSRKDKREDDFSWIGILVARHQTEMMTYGVRETVAGRLRDGRQAEIVIGRLRDGRQAEIVIGRLRDGRQAEIVIGRLTGGHLTGAAPAQSG